MKKIFLLIITLTSLSSSLLAAQIKVEVLGSGGPEIDGRASSSYIVWIDNKAKVLIDTGSGSMLRFEQSSAKIEDLEAILLSHLHIDHVVDLPSYIKAGYFSKRKWPLTVIGPDSNRYFPSTTEYLENLFGPNGAYRYMQDVLTPQSDSFELKGIDIKRDAITTYIFNSFEVDIIKVYHGIVPALAFNIRVDGKSILFSGDTSNKNGMLNKLANNVDLFVADHAVAEHAGTFAKDLHMIPSVIADAAKSIQSKRLLLSHRMKRSIGHEFESKKIIAKKYSGEIIFAEDRVVIEIP